MAKETKQGLLIFEFAIEIEAAEERGSSPLQDAKFQEEAERGVGMLGRANRRRALGDPLARSSHLEATRTVAIGGNEGIVNETRGARLPRTSRGYSRWFHIDRR